MIGDFGVPIAILIMVLVDYSIEDTYTQVRWSAHSSEEVLALAPNPRASFYLGGQTLLHSTPLVPTLPVQLRALSLSLTNAPPCPLPCRS